MIAPEHQRQHGRSVYNQLARGLLKLMNKLMTRIALAPPASPP